MEALESLPMSVPPSGSGTATGGAAGGFAQALGNAMGTAPAHASGAIGTAPAGAPGTAMPDVAIALHGPPGMKPGAAVAASLADGQPLPKGGADAGVVPGPPPGLSASGAIAPGAPPAAPDAATPDLPAPEEGTAEISAVVEDVGPADGEAVAGMPPPGIDPPAPIPGAFAGPHVLEAAMALAAVFATMPMEAPPFEQGAVENVADRPPTLPPPMSWPTPLVMNRGVPAMEVAAPTTLPAHAAPAPAGQASATEMVPPEGQPSSTGRMRPLRHDPAIGAALPVTTGEGYPPMEAASMEGGAGPAPQPVPGTTFDVPAGMAAILPGEPQAAPLTPPPAPPMLPTAPPALTVSSPTTESPATPRPMPRLAPSEQVSPVAIALSLGGGKEGRIALVLEPAELGRVEVTVDRVGDATRVQVAAERPETLALLARDGAALDRALGGAGIGTEGGRSLGFSLLGGDAGGQAMGGAQGEGRKSGRGWHSSAHGADGARQDHETPRRALLGLLDIAI